MWKYVVKETILNYIPTPPIFRTPRQRRIIQFLALVNLTLPPQEVLKNPPLNLDLLDLTLTTCISELNILSKSESRSPTPIKKSPATISTPSNQKLTHQSMKCLLLIRQSRTNREMKWCVTSSAPSYTRSSPILLISLLQHSLVITIVTISYFTWCFSMNNSLTFLSTLLTGVCLEYLVQKYRLWALDLASLNLVEDSLKLPGGGKVKFTRAKNCIIRRCLGVRKMGGVGI